MKCLFPLSPHVLGSLTEIQIRKLLINFKSEDNSDIYYKQHHRSVLNKSQPLKEQILREEALKRSVCVCVGIHESSDHSHLSISRSVQTEPTVYSVQKTVTSVEAEQKGLSVSVQTFSFSALYCLFTLYTLFVRV